MVDEQKMAEEPTQNPIKEEKIEEKVEEKPEEKTEEGATTENLVDKIKLFNRWSFKDLQVTDESLKNYINLTPVIVPHSGGKHQHKKFWKTEHISIVERFLNKMMSPGMVGKRIKGPGASKNMGKKQKIMNILYNVFSIIETKTKENPIQVLVNAIQNSAPREDTTRISMGGISYQQAVDIAPQRRIDMAIKILVQTTIGLTYSNIKTIDELIANELILAAKNDTNSRAVKRRDELERMSISAR
jgi:small subunit ribosomal protein S7